MPNTHPPKGRAGLPAIICGIVLLGAVQLARAQDAPATLDTLLERVSFNSAEKPETLGEELAKLEAGDLAKLCDMLVEPGTGDDTKPRMALHALTWYLGSSGTAAQRDKYVDALCGALEADKPREVKAFVVRQLQLVGNERAVPTLAKFLQDDEHYADAAQALLAIGGAEVAKAFRQTLAHAQGKRRIAIIDALGLLGDHESVALLREEAKHQDAQISFAAFAALSAIGDESALGARGQVSTPGWYEWCRANALVLRLPLVLAPRADHQDDYAAAVEGLFPVMLEYDAVHMRCAALHVFAEVAQAVAVEYVLEAMTDDELERSAAATETGVTIPGKEATGAFIAELKRAEAATRARILNVLTRRGDAAALPAAVEALKDEDKDVRLAAVKAVATLGKERAVGPLVAFLGTDEGDERKAAEDVLTGLAGEDVARKIAAAIAGRSAGVRAALLDVLARRRARAQLDTIHRFTTDEDESVRIAAIKAVGELANESAAPKLLPLLKKADSDAEREALALALASTCSRAESPAMRAAPIIAAIDRTGARDYCSLLRVLGRIGGPQALDQLRQAARDARAEVKGAAVRSFLEWPDATAAEPVLEIAKEAEELKHHVLAMRAYARLVGLDAKRPAKKTLRMYAAGLDAARRVEERKMLLSGLAEIKDAQTLAVLEPYLGNEQLRAEAASAMITVADGLLPGGWVEARTALESVLAATEVENIRTRAEDVLRRVAECEDFITDWLASGPYRQGGKKGNELFDVVFPPEEPDAGGVEWKRQPVSKDPARYWYVDLVRSCGGSHPVGYLRTYVFSPKTQDVLLEFGSDDGIKVWLNGEVIHANNVPRGCDRAQDKVKATLNEGWNELLLKITNIGGGWGACVRVRSPDGGRLEGLKLDAGRQP